MRARIRSLLADTRQFRQDFTSHLGYHGELFRRGEAHHAAEGHAGFRQHEIHPPQSQLQGQDGAAPLIMPTVPLWEAQGATEELSGWEAGPQTLAAEEVGAFSHALAHQTSVKFGILLLLYP